MSSWGIGNQWEFNSATLTGTTIVTAASAGMTLQGNTACQMTFGGTQVQMSNAGSNGPFVGNVTDWYCAFHFRTTANTTNVADQFTDLLILLNSSAVMTMSLRLVAKASSGGLALRLFNNTGSAQIGTDQTIVSGTQYTVEVHLLSGTGATCTAELKINGVTVISVASLTIAANTHFWFLGQNPNGVNNPANATGNIWYADFATSNSGFIGEGSVIYRQIASNSVATNHNQWTYSTGTTMSGVVDQTPPATTTNLHSSTSGTASAGNFSGVVDFTTTGGTGSSATLFGTGVVGASDTINGFKIGAYGLTASTTSDAADITIFRTPAGAGGADTTKTMAAAWILTAMYVDTHATSNPTAAQVRSCEVGLRHAANTIAHTCYSIWAVVHYTLAAVPTGNLFHQADMSGIGDGGPFFGNPLS